MVLLCSGLEMFQSVESAGYNNLSTLKKEGLHGWNEQQLERVMKIGIMQPYSFPYIGYFQLLYHSDIFVLYDDANYIERGWVNRNYLLAKGGKELFSIPLSKASCNRAINEILIQYDDGKWFANFLRGLDMRYSRAPHKSACLELLERVFSELSASTTIGDMSYSALLAIMSYLGITREVLKSSTLSYDRSLDRSGKVNSIARMFTEVERLVFPPGSCGLYSTADFPAYDCEVVVPGRIKYPQIARDFFVPDLSIIDVLMFNSPVEVARLLQRYEIRSLDEVLAADDVT